MFIKIVDINGRYSPETGEHITPSHMPEGYYARLTPILARAASRGASVLYQPNLTSFTHDIFSNQADVDRALATDPFLMAFGTDEGLIISPQGQRPLDLVKKEVALEDSLVRKHGTAVVLGAYTKWCVSASAHNIASRNPGFLVGIDPELSIDNGGSFVDRTHAMLPHISVTNFAETK